MKVLKVAWMINSNLKTITSFINVCWKKILKNLVIKILSLQPVVFGQLGQYKHLGIMSTLPTSHFKREGDLLKRYLNIQIYNKKTTRVPVLSHHLSVKREGDEFFTEGGLVNENSNEGGFLFIMNLKIYLTK